MKKAADTLILVPYNRAWAAQFEKLKAFFTEHLRDLIIGIEHIGSTSVEGLAAKPIIDLDVVIDSYEVFPEIVSRLRAIGFTHEGDLGVKDREAFKQTVPDDFMDYHLYVCLKYSAAHLAHVKFRDYLRAHPEVANEYALEKQWALGQCNGDRNTYTNMKSHFVKGVLNDTDDPETLIQGGRISIRRACIKDAAFISATEADPANSPWVANWPLRLRICKLGDDDFLQTIIELKDKTPVGFIIFNDLQSKDRHIQLKRIALANEYKNMGYGKDALYLSQKLAFEVFNAEKLYLSTKKENTKAQSIYKATGFTPEEPDPCTHFHIKRADYSDTPL